MRECQLCYLTENFYKIPILKERKSFTKEQNRSIYLWCISRKSKNYIENFLNQFGWKKVNDSKGGVWFHPDRKHGKTNTYDRVNHTQAISLTQKWIASVPL